MAKVIVVGINDPYHKTPLHPNIPSSSGQRLWMMTGLSMPVYLQSFERYNLFSLDESQSITLARFRASDILSAIADREYRTYIVCLGRVVAEGFGVSIDVAPLVFVKVQNNVAAAYMPHTSGLNRWYNSRDNADAANKFMRQLGAVASGEIDDLPESAIVESK